MKVFITSGHSKIGETA